MGFTLLSHLILDYPIGFWETPGTMRFLWKIFSTRYYEISMLWDQPIPSLRQFGASDLIVNVRVQTQLLGLESPQFWEISN